jgi:ketosteroid isomerase-like protein
MSSLTPVRAFYDAVARGDVTRILSILHPNLAWTEAEGFPYFSGTWHHPQEVVEKLLIPLGRDWEGFAATPQELLVDGDRVVAFGVYLARPCVLRLRTAGRFVTASSLGSTCTPIRY